MNIMRKKKNDSEVLSERAKDLETLIYYFSVTRVFQCKEYHDKCGGFSYIKFKTQKGWVLYWKDKTPEFQNKHYKTHAIYQKTYNEVLGIPCELLNDILGEYPESGKRIKFAEALEVIGGEAKWTVVNDGRDAYTDKETNQRIVKDSWNRKVYPALPLVWVRLLHNPQYVRLDTIPNASDRAKEIIHAWETANKLFPFVKDGNISIEAVKQRMMVTVKKTLVNRVVTWFNRMMKQQKGN